MSGAKSRSFGLNPRAIILSFVVILLVLGVGVWLKISQANRLRKAVLAQAERHLKEGQPAKALLNLNRFLDASPNDIAALEIKGRLLADSARGSDQLREAAMVNDLLLRLDPGGPGRQQTRGRLAELYIRFSDALRGSELARDAPELAGLSLRYRNAEIIAREMVRIDPKDASAHRLLGMSLDGQAGTGESDAADQAARSYEEALRLDPGDIGAAERLAALYQGRKKDPKRAEAVLDALLRSDPTKVEIHLARFRHFDRFDERDKASAELAEAVALAPSNSVVRLVATEYAMRTGKVKEARQQFDALPTDAQETLRSRLIGGMIDLAESRPDAAIEGWRASLEKTGGTDAELSWWLAFTLLRLDRVAEAQPLVIQFRRLIGDPDSVQARFLQALLEEKTDRPLDAIAKLEGLKEKIGESLRPMLLLTLGRCYQAVWDESRALEAYRAAAALAPGDPGPRLATAKLIEARRPEEALVYLRREAGAAQSDPSLKLALASALLRREARLPAARRSWVEFDAAFSSAQAAMPSSPGLVTLHADRLGLSGDLAGVLTQLEAATLASPRDASTWLARATALDRMSKPEEALRVLEAASAPKAAGDQVVIRIAVARLLTSLGRGREARDRLTQILGKLGPADKARVHEELGRLLAAQGDSAAARLAFQEWALISPDSSQPRLALLDLGLATDDDALIKSSVAALKSLGGSQAILGRLSQVIEILREITNKDASVRDTDPAVKLAREKAATLLSEVRRDAPEVPTVALLNGQLLDELGRIDEAAAEYRKAWDRGIDAALPRLVSLLVRHRRVDDLLALRRDHPGDARLERLLALAAKQLGDTKSVDTLITSTAQDVNLPEARVARAQALASVGKIAEAEALLRARAEEGDDREAPWIDLLRFQVQNGRKDAFPATIATIKSRVKSRRPEVTEAGCLELIGDRAGSEKAIAAALKAYPDDPEVLVAAAGVSRVGGRNDEVVDFLRRALKLNPKQIGVARQLSVTLAQSASDLPSWQEAWNTLEPESTDAEARLIRAFVLLRSPEPDRRREAIPLLEALLADLNVDHPVARGAREYLIRQLVAEKQFDRASQVAAVSIARGFDAAMMAIYVEILLLNKDRDQARKQLDRWHSSAPDDPREAKLRVRFLKENTNPDELAAVLEKTYLERKDGPGAEEFGVEAFQALVALGKPGDAAASRLAEGMAAKSPRFSWLPARLAARDGRRADAIRLARASIAAGGEKEALRVATIASLLAGSAKDNRVDLDDAASLMDAAVERGPKVAEIHIMAGIIRHYQGRYEDEAKCYRTALIHKPKEPVARNNLAWILCEDLGKPSEGLPMIEELIREVGPTPDRLGTRGVVQMRLGKYPEAVRDLEESIKARPAALTSYYLALTYRKLGRTADSLRNLDVARREGLNPSDIDIPQRAEYQTFVASTGGSR